MPLDNLQRDILKVIASNRSPESVFAGGSVLHRHGFRLSGDHDIFHPAYHAIAELAARDVQSLRSAGYEVEILIPIRIEEMQEKVSKALEEAREIFDVLPARTAGHLFVNLEGDCLDDPREVVEGLKDGSVRTIRPSHGGYLPSSPEADTAMIQRLIDVHGFEGEMIP